MPTPPRSQLPDFFQRNNLSSIDHQACIRHIQAHWPDHGFEEVEQQGACSWTLLLRRRGLVKSTTRVATDDPGTSLSNRNDLIVQVRPARHVIHPLMAKDARMWYPSLAPEWREVATLSSGDDGKERLQVCCMDVLRGRRVSEIWFLEGRVDAPVDRRMKLTRLLKSLAMFFARAWCFADGMTRTGKGVWRCDGRVGRSIGERLRMLERRLPSRGLRQVARKRRKRVQGGGLDPLPVVLTHGDLIPSNILVDEESWELSGLVDWAEAEYLPFGMSLYCVDHLLGSMRRCEDGKAEVTWEEGADELRASFWTDLKKLIPAIEDPPVSKAVSLARDVGVLLWHGIAFDDGKIDRVVEGGKDDKELACLSAFLDSTSITPQASL